MLVACDFDSTICAPRTAGSSYRMGAPEPGVVAALNHLVSKGHAIVIFTAREVQKPNVYKAVDDWCKYFHLPISGITNVKRPEFDLYIDNRALHYGGNWTQTLADLARFENDLQIKNYRTSSPTPLTDITQPL